MSLIAQANIINLLSNPLRSVDQTAINEDFLNLNQRLYSPPWIINLRNYTLHLLRNHFSLFS